jgi:hypothetical protein
LIMSAGLVSSGPQTSSHRFAQEGLFVELDGWTMARIIDHDRMPAFLMSIVSEGDLWMFVSSYGGLTCGRGDAGRPLFRYQTDDLLHQAHLYSGPYTRMWLSVNGQRQAWEPLTGTDPDTRGRRTLYKSVLGNRVCFEERRDGLGLTFRYTWCSAQPFGWVREAELLLDRDAQPIEASWLDGLRAVLPSGADGFLLNNFHCLVNAYRRSEVDTATGLAVFPLQSLIMDRAEPGEALTANVAWCQGVESPSVVLSDAALRCFAETGQVSSELELKGRLSHYLLHQSQVLQPGESRRWRIVADVALDQPAVVSLREKLRRDPGALQESLDSAISEGNATLRKLIASADGLQCTADLAASKHHLANVMFNAMRGGIFADGYTVDRGDLLDFISSRNGAAASRLQSVIQRWPAKMQQTQMLTLAKEANDPALERLCLEYLPLYFGRRHGDPSRPWNRFSIKVRRPDGSRALDYEGNWRDIFQNWEALCLSFPEFFEPVIAKFVNATTADGFNPYRISRSGIDWEVPEPHNPWAGIGYWGDHQIIYLCKLVEWSRKCHPGRLASMLDRAVFSFADVPYRLASHAAMIDDPHRTITFDQQAHDRAMQRVKDVGADGRLLHDAQGHVVQATLAEKLLIPILSKLSSYVAGGGIWMNTQRPEWNDANNALVGYGISMVTLCYLRRHILEVVALLREREGVSIALDEPVARWLESLDHAFTSHRDLLDSHQIAPARRRSLLDALGGAFERYRASAYDASFGMKREPVKLADLAGRLEVVVPYLDHAIRANRRSDGLYHAYNLLRIDERGGAYIDHLYEMLEGQVAVLSSGLLDGQEASQVIDALYASPLYREDQHSFLLYPNRDLQGFFERNKVSADAVAANPLLSALIEAGDTRVIHRDDAGAYRFASTLVNARALVSVLDALSNEPRWKEPVRQHRAATLPLYEQTFNHRAFTGRSGGMFGYEGLGCIYWHMVSKLWLAVQENARAAVERGEPREVLNGLVERYHRIRQGLSAAKSPLEYGAFPTDPYSHTPAHAGAQQPGMTGQVKEEIIARIGELGATVKEGRICFDSLLLRDAELLGSARDWSIRDATGRFRKITIPPRGLGFLLMQTPIVIQRVEEQRAFIEVDDTASGCTRFEGLELPAAISTKLFERQGTIAQVRVTL